MVYCEKKKKKRWYIVYGVGSVDFLIYSNLSNILVTFKESPFKEHQSLG